MKVSTRENIQTQKEGVRLSRANSDNLFDSAELLSSSGFYSPAIPLLILSAEEIIKGFALSLEFFLGSDSEVKKIITDSRSKDVNSYLFNHQDKHKLAQAIIKDLHAISPVFSFARALIPKKNKINLDFFCLSPEQYDNADKLISAFTGFNTLKNQGLYVDNINGTWETPLRFNVADYKDYKEKMVLIRSIFSPRIEQFLNLSDDDLLMLMEAINEL